MDSSFTHVALALTGQKKLVYTAFSKHFFYYRMLISKYVLEKGCVPLNPFMLFDYFLLDSVDRNCVREANNAVVLRADEVWVFGAISNGVLAEIILAQNLKKPVLFFKANSSHTFEAISPKQIEMEEEVKTHRHLIQGDS